MAKVRIVDVPRGEFFGGAGAAVWSPSRDKPTSQSLGTDHSEQKARVFSCEESLLELVGRVDQTRRTESKVEVTIQQGPAYKLSVSIAAGMYGHHLKFCSFVPTARRPEEQVRFQTTLTRVELLALHQAIGSALQDE